VCLPFCQSDIFQAGHAPGVDPHQDLDAAPCPGRDPGRRDTGVKAPGDAGMPQIVGAAQQWRGDLLGCEGAFADFELAAM
jgi:hypothetical protein